MSNSHSFKNTFLSVLFCSFLITIGILVGVNKREAILGWFGKATSDTKSTPMYAKFTPRTYAETTALPKPKLTGGMTVENAIQQRRSRREFTDKSVTMSELSQLLWAAQGITDTKTGHRAAPSARESYPFTVFVVVRNVAGLEPGLYEYLPKEHALGDMKLSNAGELLSGAGVQPGAQNAPVVFVLSAAYGNAEEKLGANVVSSSLIEAGHIGQNMYLQTESLKMGMVVMAGFDPKKVGTAMSLDPAETVVYLMPFGHPAPISETVLGTSTVATKNFTAEELLQYDGKEGRKAYFGYEGKVYDVTGSTLWKEGEHYGLFAGHDLTGKLGDAPHGAEVLSGFPVMGTFGASPTPLASAPATQNNQWYYVVGAALVVAAALVMFGRSSKKKKRA